MKEQNITSTISVLGMTDHQIKQAQRVAKTLGYGESTAYTSTSAAAGLYCLPLTNAQKRGVLVQTKELGLIFIQGAEDLGLD